MDLISWPAVGACILPNLGGWVGSFFLKNSINTWYKDLKKAPWNPPNAVFTPIWTLLYTAMGFASFLVWRDGGGFNEKTALPLTMFAIQLLVNWAFTPIFFGWRSVKWALVDIVLLDVGAAACAVIFSHINPTAGALFIPYLLWLCLATTLSIYIYIHNSSKHHHEKHRRHGKDKDH